MGVGSELWFELVLMDINGWNGNPLRLKYSDGMGTSRLGILTGFDVPTVTLFLSNYYVDSYASSKIVKYRNFMLPLDG